MSAVTETTPERGARPTRPTRSEGERFALQLETVNLVLVLVAYAVTHLIAGVGPMMWGVLVGGGIGVLNLRSMVFLGRRILMGRQQGRAKYMLLFALKLGLLCTVVWLCLANLPIHSIGFLIGFSTLLPAALVTTALRSLERPSNPEEPRP